VSTEYPREHSVPPCEYPDYPLESPPRTDDAAGETLALVSAQCRPLDRRS
jgi:hypothetical protein